MKNIIVTGSASGFGLLTVRTLAAQGHTVYATMRNVHSTNAAAALELRQWAKAHGTQLEVVELDVTSNESVRKAMAQITQRSGGVIDVLVNNAGLSYLGTGEALTIEQTEQLYQVNTIGPERMMKAVLPFMHRQHEGLIINITSVQSRQFVPILSTYNGTKAALDAVSVGYHYELKSAGIEVATIQPGSYPTTDVTAKSLEAGNSAVEKQYGSDVIRFKEALFRYFEPTPESPDAQEVADAIARLVNLPKGERPLWTIMGGGPLADTFDTINRLIKQIVETNLDALPKAYAGK